ncbi:MAG: hypothetical protein M3545_09070 [Acidobacteriota bacterium]|nr:hypothetical protein [Acidobacteriota bacterium]
MADDSEELASRGEHVIKSGTLAQQILVGFLTLDREEADLRGALLAQCLVGRCPLVQERRVRQHPFALNDTARGTGISRQRGLPVGAGAGCRKHRVGARPRPADHGVRRVIDCRQVRRERVIRLLTLNPEALVRLLPL